MMTGGHIKNRRSNAVLKKHECLFCQRQFSWYQRLEQHMLIHTQERPFICSECGTCMKSFADHRDHIRVVHLGIKWTCSYCGQEFNALSNMCAHRKRMHENGKSKPNFKAKPMVKKSKSNARIRGNPVVKIKPVTNTKSKFKSKAIIQTKPMSKSKKPVVKTEPLPQTHKIPKVKIKQVLRTKSIANTTPVVKASFPAHIGATNAGGRTRKIYKCDICRKIFFSTDIGSLNRHKQTVHGEGPRRKPPPKKPVQFWKCDICGKVFRCHDRHSLFRHKTTVHGLSQKYLSETIDQEPNLPFFYHPNSPPPTPKQQETDDMKYSTELSFDIPPLDFNFHPPFKLVNFPALLPPRKILDASFFLHMNRYTPEEPEVTVSKISLPIYLPPQVKKESQGNEQHLSSSPAPVAVTPIIKLEQVDITESTVAKKKAPPPPPPPLSKQTELKPVDLDLIEVELKSSSNVSHDTRYGPPQRCEKCDTILANTASFQRHLQIADCVLLKRLRETPIASLWYSCHFCHKDFGDRRSHLLRHIVALHKYPNEEDDPDEDDNDKKVACAFCGLKFNSRQNTQQHILLNHHNMLGVPRDEEG